MSATPSTPSRARPPDPGFLRRMRTALSRILEREPVKVTTESRRGGDRRYLDPAVIARFGPTPLLARRVVEGFLSGLHRSPFRGFSVEFADHREYVPGDDLKFLDWMLYARTDHYYIKRSVEETNVRCFIMLDRSASMGFGTEGLTKWDYACFLASCFGYLMLKQQDAVGLCLFGDRPGVMVPARCRSTHLHELMRAMVRNPPAGGTDAAASLKALVGRLKRRSLVVVISDLIDDPEETARALRLIGAHGHDVIVFHVQDPAETDLAFEGAAVFRDLETGEELEADPKSLREAYAEEARNLSALYRKRLADAGIDYVPLPTSQPYDTALAAYLKRRSDIRG
jgi:uncharacterized protein (DUF58 family)